MSLPLGLAALVLVAAVTHAAWNALAKGSDDRLIAFALIQGVPIAVAAGLAPFVPIPEAAAWPYLIGSVIIHNGYFFFLMEAYRDGDLSHVYPLARGSAPLLVALVMAVLAIETPTTWGMIGIALVSAGIASLTFAGRNHYPSGMKPVGLALLTGLFITGYTFCDGLGTRLAGTPASYIVWMFLLAGIPFCLATAVVRRGRLAADLRGAWKGGTAAGLLSMFAYALVMYAMSQGALAYVSALRETSVLFAALIGTLVLREPFGLPRILAATVIASGIAVMQTLG